jgi:hypothetical protein
MVTVELSATKRAGKFFEHDITVSLEAIFFLPLACWQAAQYIITAITQKLFSQFILFRFR